MFDVRKKLNEHLFYLILIKKLGAQVDSSPSVDKVGAPILIIIGHISIKYVILIWWNFRLIVIFR